MSDSIIRGHKHIGAVSGWSIVVEARNDEVGIFELLKTEIGEYLRFKDRGNRLIYAGCTGASTYSDTGAEVVIVGEDIEKNLFIASQTLGRNFSYSTHLPLDDWVLAPTTVQGIYSYMVARVFRDKHQENPRIFIGIGVALHNYTYGQSKPEERDETPPKRQIRA